MFPNIEGNRISSNPSYFYPGYDFEDFFQKIK